MNFLDLKINKLGFDIYDKRISFLFIVNIFPHYMSCLHKYVYKNSLLNTKLLYILTYTK